MEDQSGAYKSLGSVGKTISTIGWILLTIGGLLLIFAVVLPDVRSEITMGLVVAGGVLIPFGFLAVISGQVISVFVAVARNTETTNNILERHTNILERHTDLLETI